MGEEHGLTIGREARRERNSALRLQVSGKKRVRFVRFGMSRRRHNQQCRNGCRQATEGGFHDFAPSIKKEDKTRVGARDRSMLVVFLI
ncbi:MAG: hypothetical protein AAFR82_04035 [Pseudomonadota bacterium]